MWVQWAEETGGLGRREDIRAGAGGQKDSYELEGLEGNIRDPTTGQGVGIQGVWH